MERAFEFRKARKLKKIQIISSSFERIPKNTLSISSDNLNGVLKLIEIIKEDEDVQNVYSKIDYNNN